MKNYIVAGVALLALTGSLAAQSTITDVDGPGGRSITAFDRQSSRTIGGYMDTEFIMAEDSDSTFKAHRFVLEASSQINDKILVNSEIEYEYGGNSDNDGEIKIEQAWLDYKISDALVQRTGIIVVPFGRVNVLHDSDVRDLTNRPLYAKYIVPTTWMDTGFGFHGVMDVAESVVNYSVYAINGLSGSDSADISQANGIRSTRPSFKTDNNGDKALVGHIGISPSLGLDLGASVYSGKYNDGGSKGLSIVGVDGAYKKGRYEIIGEYASVSIEDGAVESMNGGYIEGRAHVLQEWLSSVTSLKNPVITLVGRYGMVNTDVDNDYKTSRMTVGLNFRPVETVVYKAEYQVEDYDQPSYDDSKGTFLASVAVGF